MPLSAFHFLATLGLLAATSTKKTSSSSSGFFLIFIVIIAGVYFLFIAPQRRKQRAQMSQQRTFEVGDEVVTTGGIYGRVESSEGDRVALDVAEGVILEVARTAIARRVPAGAADSEEPSGAEAPTAGDWEPPEPEESGSAGANGASATSSNGSGGAVADTSGDWAEPWAAPPADGEKGAPGAGGSS